MTQTKPNGVERRGGGNNTTAHSDLVASIRLCLGREPDLVLWLNRPEHVERWNPSAGGAMHSTSGLPRGSADLVGILSPSGRWISLEVKTGRGELRPDQQLHLELVRKRGGFAAVVRSEDEAVAAINRARTGASS